MDDLSQKARNILKANDQGGYTVPHAKIYPFQWNWDSAFCALGWMTFDEPRAWQELHMLFKGQWPSGKLPHIVFHQDAETYFPGPDWWHVDHMPKTSGITQPPLVASMVLKMIKIAKDEKLAEENLKILFPKILAYHRWFHNFRDPEHTGVVACIHPWETGRDNAREWDPALEAIKTDHIPAYTRKDTHFVDQAERPTDLDYDRYVALIMYLTSHQYDRSLYFEAPFRVADIGTNCILLRANKDLAELARRLGKTAIARELLHIIERQKRGIQKLLQGTHSGFFYSKNLVTRRRLRKPGAMAFIPFYAGLKGKTEGQAQINSFDQWAGQVRYMCPSLNPDSPDFEQTRYWSGPVWAVVNYLLIDGFNRAGFTDHAEKLKEDTLELFQNGFWEYYDPQTGQGLGGADFSWTAAVYLAMKTEL